jgi:copper(I)-binding protein
VKRLAAAIALLGLAACGQGGAHLTVDKTEYRPPIGASGIGVAYFSVRSDQADRIIGISSPQADHIEIHASVTNGTQVSMKQLDSVDLPAGQAVTFAPRGMHLMIFAPRPAAPDATFPIQIELQSGRSETFAFHPALITPGDHQ